MSKKEKRSAKNFFIPKYVVKSFKISNFYYIEILAQLNFLWRYDSLKFLIFTSKIRVKSETLAIKIVIPTAKNRIFLDTCFWIEVGHLRYLGI